MGPDDDPDLTTHLESVLVGGLEARTVEIVDYTDEWPVRFAHEKERLAEALEGTALRIKHIGSTAVPGLAAKPVVDILVTVADAEDEHTFRAAIEALGYELRVREPGHRAFRTAARDVNLHIWADDDPEVERHLLFRDRLRNDARDRARYEDVKRELATRRWTDINYYAEAKNEVVAEILQRAGWKSPP